MTLRPQQSNACFADEREGLGREITFGRHYRLDERRITQQLLVPLSSRMIDVLRVASTIYAVDRLVRRQRRSPSDWGRRISCSIPVRDYDFWTMARVVELIGEAIDFVSGDRWQLQFTPDVTPRYAQQQVFEELRSGDNSTTCLYSGGLDSAAGLAARLLQGVPGPVIPVTVRHRTDLTTKASQQLKFLAGEFGVKLTHVSVPMSMVSPQKLVPAEERSQRARSFLFVCVGGVVAWSAGSLTLEVYESGVGAINAPLLAGMQGSQATRSVHPHFLRRMGQLLSLAAGRPIDVTLPFQQMTKGEVVKSLSSGRLPQLAADTVSCVSYPLRDRLRKSCGVCPACIFRRVALEAAGIAEPPERYEHDLLHRKSSHLSPEHLRCLKAFLLQVDNLSQVEQQRLPEMISRHLRQTRVLERGQNVDSYVPLYARYRREWLSFIGKARSHDCDWTDLIDLAQHAA